MNVSLRSKHQAPKREAAVDEVESLLRAGKQRAQIFTYITAVIEVMGFDNPYLVKC